MMSRSFSSHWSPLPPPPPSWSNSQLSIISPTFLLYSPIFLTSYSWPNSGLTGSVHVSHAEFCQAHTTVMSSCFPSKFCISRRQTLNESLVVSSVHTKEASYSLPVLRCSAVTRTTGVSLNLFYMRLKDEAETRWQNFARITRFPSLFL